MIRPIILLLEDGYAFRKKVREKEQEMRQITRQATHQVSQQRVIAALTKLSRLALRTSVPAQGSAEQWATLLLKQLLTLCTAQQGALFIAREETAHTTEP